LAHVKIATWNVNGIRARFGQLVDWIAAEQPDVICLQEIKATLDQIPALLPGLDGYWTFWHGAKGYSGVALHVRKAICPQPPVFMHPAFDCESRAVAVEINGLVVSSIYVPNGGRDLPGKLRFLEGMADYVRDVTVSGRRIVLCGDLNVARTDMDVHPKERKPLAVGQLPEERALLERVLSHGLVDVARLLHPDDDQLFTWWAPWRNLRQRNIGWRIDYVLTSESIARRARTFVSQREVGTSDHAPLVAVFDCEAQLIPETAQLQSRNTDSLDAGHLPFLSLAVAECDC
jgi:exodeoxyribonuclease-3